tara:strand:+ start:115 stop:1014 length:900 start_codon:yes stop_codon:yes gene_type:complete
MEELKDYIMTAYAEKIPTQKTYLNTYKQLTKLSISKEEMDNDDKVIEKIKNSEYSSSSKRSILNLIVIYRNRCMNEEIDKIAHPLAQYREELRKEETKQKVLKKEQLQKELPSRKKLVSYMNSEYDKGNYKNYVVNYMLLNYYVRNVDCNVLLFDNENPELEDCNYMVFQDNKSVVWQRNKYKTCHIWGKQQHIISDDKFYNSCRELFSKENGNNNNGVPIFKTTKETQVSDTCCGWYVANSTYQGIGEGKYLKINLEHINNKKNTMNILNKISETRGTGAKHLITDYNITQSVNDILQ